MEAIILTSVVLAVIILVILLRNAKEQIIILKMGSKPIGFRMFVGVTTFIIILLVTTQNSEPLFGEPDLGDVLPAAALYLLSILTGLILLAIWFLYTFVWGRIIIYTKHFQYRTRIGYLQKIQFTNIDSILVIHSNDVYIFKISLINSEKIHNLNFKKSADAIQFESWLLSQFGDKLHF